MPKSKRDKKVSLTKTKRKGFEHKQKLVEDVRQCVDKYKHIFTFTVENMRNNKFKEMKHSWHDSKFFFGKNKVMAVAMGRSVEDEYKENLHLVSKCLKGQTGLLFTNKSEAEVLKFFKDYKEDDFARTGCLATQTIIVDAGPLKSFPHSIEPHLRQLGMPTTLQKGVVTLVKDHKICSKGDTLTPEQRRLLKLFNHKMAVFRVVVECMWNTDGKFQLYKHKRDEVKVQSSLKITSKQIDDDESGTFFQAEPLDTDDEDDEKDDSDDDEMESS